MSGTGCQVFGRGLFSCWLLLLDDAAPVPAVKMSRNLLYHWAGTRGGELHDNNIIGMVRLLAPVRQNKYLTLDQIHVVSTMGIMYRFSLNL